MSNAARQVCDGWDAAVKTAAGERVTLHFGRRPTEADVSAALVTYETGLAEAKAARETAAAAAEAARIVVELEDGSYA